jgi:hypothetical protein
MLLFGGDGIIVISDIATHSSKKRTFQEIQEFNMTALCQKGRPFAMALEV